MDKKYFRTRQRKQLLLQSKWQGKKTIFFQIMFENYSDKIERGGVFKTLTSVRRMFETNKSY